MNNTRTNEKFLDKELGCYHILLQKSEGSISMTKILVLILLCVSSVFAGDLIRVVPKTDYPIIQPDSVFSWTSVRSECLPATESEPAERCTVKKLSDLGRINDINFYYVLYEWLDKEEVAALRKLDRPIQYPRTNTAVILFYSSTTSPNMLHPFYADRTDFNVGWFEEPRMLRTRTDTFLQIPHRGQRTSDVELDTLLRWDDSKWHLVDTQSWVDDLQSRVPEECSVQTDTLIDFESMKATNYLWRTSDANCCPSCGRFTANLAIDEDRLVITNLKYDMKARK
jgi:hypothetical protein